MLHHLSTELLEHISSFLGGLDLSSIRLVCRSLRDRTTAVFGRAWLSTVETGLSDGSLHRLQTIAAHEIFRHSVCVLRIVEECKYPSLLGGHRNWPRQLSCDLDLSSALVRNFQDSLRRFDNCTTLEVCDRGGDSFHENGATIGLSPYDSLNLALSVMVTGARPVQPLSIYLEREYTYRTAKHLPMNAINSTLFPFLQELDIKLYIGDEVVEQVLYLIQAATHLKRLCFNFANSTNGDSFLHQLAAVPTLPPIINLRFGRMLLESCTDLIKVILRFEKSLRVLHIGHVSIDSGEWNSLFSELSRHDFTYLEIIAVCVLYASLPQDQLGRGSLYFCPLRLKQKMLEKCGGAFEFMLAPCRQKRRVFGVRYTGPRVGMKLALKALADDSHYVTSLDPRSPSPGLPNMGTFTGDRVGRVVPRFDQFQTWEGVSS